MPHLSIIIINYNTYQYTVNCIRSIKKWVTHLDYEIILVDNASKECSAQNFQNEFPEINLIALAVNVGFGRGNNEGIKVAKASTLLLLNSDILVVDNTIELTYQFLIEQKETGMVGCKLLNEDRTEQLSSFIHVRFPFINLLVNSNPFLSKLSRTLNIPKNYDHARATYAAQKNTHSCEAVSGAFMMVKKEVIEQCGDFDPDFFMYCEDTEWCRNRIVKKFQIKYYADAAVIHLGGKSSSSLAVQKQTQLSSFLYNYKTGWMDYALALAITALNSACNLVALPFFTRGTRKSIIIQQQSLLSIIPYLFWSIPRYKRAYGSRPYPLLIDEYKVR